MARAGIAEVGALLGLEPGEARHDASPA
jgi:hypothetical protein